MEKGRSTSRTTHKWWEWGGIRVKVIFGPMGETGKKGTKKDGREPPDRGEDQAS